MTTIYFVRHAEPNYENHDDLERELSHKGLRDRALVTQFLSDKRISVVLSSPYKRAVDTVSEFAKHKKINIVTIDDFRERRVNSEWIPNFDAFCRKQWEDFQYKLTDGESLSEVQKRNIAALQSVLETYQGKNIVIGTHGTALSTIINYYDKDFGYCDFQKIKKLMPWVVRMEFDLECCVTITQYDLFKEEHSTIMNQEDLP